MYVYTCVCGEKPYISCRALLVIINFIFCEAVSGVRVRENVRERVCECMSECECECVCV